MQSVLQLNPTGLHGIGNGAFSRDWGFTLDGENETHHIAQDYTDTALKLGVGSTIGATNKTGLLITSGSYVGTPLGNTWGSAVMVADGESGDGKWVKLAAAPAFAGNYGSYSAVYAVSLNPYGHTNYQGDDYFIVRVRYTRNATGTTDADMTDVVVEAINSGHRSNVDIQADHFVLTYDGVNGAELWVQLGSNNEHQYTFAWVSTLHASSNKSHYQVADEHNLGGWEIQSGQSWQASMDSMLSLIHI